MGLRVGILVVGSLYWDNTPARKLWRAERLTASKSLSVLAKIRYGRLSSSRGNTYTMVFSASIAPGTAKVLPCKASIETMRDLLNEADALSEAEGLGDGSLWKPFGCVGVLANPSSAAALDVLPDWSVEFRKRLNPNADITQTRALGEDPTISQNGVLNLPWPTYVASGRQYDGDMLLATATSPSLESGGRYPSTQQIALAIVRSGYSEYFCNNVLNGLATVEDRDIWRHIRAASPSWLNAAKYDRVNKAMS